MTKRAAIAEPGDVRIPSIPATIQPPDRRFWIAGEMIPVRENGSPRLWFSTSTVANVFLGRSPAWLRLRMRPGPDHPHGMLTLEGKPIGIHRTEFGDRQFSLADIERCAHALYLLGEIDAERFATAIMMVLWCARQRGVLPAVSA